MSLALVKHDEEDEDKQQLGLVDCPICLNPMSTADIVFPLVCPTTNCNDFNICLHCIHGMLQSEADGYQEASDGSHQVKFCVACPACRTRYNPLAVNNHKSNSSPKSEKYDQSIIHHVILLRRVYAVQLLLDVKHDSDLSATQLSLKYDFLQHAGPDLSLQKIKDAAVLFGKYLKDIKKYEDTVCTKKNAIPELDWTKLETLMLNSNSNISSQQNLKQATRNGISSSSSSSNGTERPSNNNKEEQSQPPSQSQQQQQQPWRDVTLFYGVLQDVMTVSEQEFLTQLFTSGQPDLVAQAAHIVHGILTMSTRTSTSSYSSSSSSSVVVAASKKTTSTATTTTTTKASQLSPKKLAQLRGRFPLPQHMPLCVALPVYDPTSRSPLLSFEPVKKHQPQPQRNLKKSNEQQQNSSSTSDSSSDNSNHNSSSSCNELIVARVHGPAGRLGLRRGDVVTHVQGGCETVHNRAAWDAHLQQLLQSSNNNNNTNNASSSSPTAANLSKTTNDSKNNLVTFVVVNANAETATALKERAMQMQRELKQW